MNKNYIVHSKKIIKNSSKIVTLLHDMDRANESTVDVLMPTIMKNESYFYVPLFTGNIFFIFIESLGFSFQKGFLLLLRQFIFQLSILGEIQS